MLNKRRATLMTTASRKVYIETLGCQMNQNDSELMAGLLALEGFDQTADKHQADLVIINTCQIRGNAEDKAYSYLGAWRKLKDENPHLKIAMTGCVAQQTQEDVFERAPYVDIVIGTQNIHDLPRLVQEAFGEAPSKKLFATDRQKEKSTYDFIEDITPIRQSRLSAWITIIEGCDYFCTYCVVPYTRGRQISRPKDSILQEIKRLADSGYKEVTLLGQTVDSYGKDFTGNTRYGLADLLTDIHEAAPSIDRIRFMTSHPLDLTDEIIMAIRDLPRVMEAIHIPMQAGSNNILHRMRRGYTREAYFELVDKIRHSIPECAITGDFIVGFPGETDAEFEESLEAVVRASFDSAITASYSARKQTPAGVWENNGQGVISESLKDARLQQLNTVIKDVAAQKNAALLGQSLEVLVEGKSKRAKFDRWTGRTRTNKLVHFDAPDSHTDYTGLIQSVTISQTSAWSMIGSLDLLP
jgi:tRNA-2-methylthio-N6-dimethylallyladenosine synthase